MTTPLLAPVAARPVRRGIRRVVAAILASLTTVALCLMGIAFALLSGSFEDTVDVAGCGTGELVDPTGEMPPIAELIEDQVRIAAIIVRVGQDMNVPPRGWVIAVATALQESRLQNLPHLGEANDHDSIGVFQQRPSQGWGTPEQLADPAYQARKFYEKLLTIPGWENLPLTVAAQRVQVSAFPDAYAKWEQRANEVVGAVSGIVCPPGARDGGVLPANPWARVVVQRALSQIGVPYAWGGGNAHGPTRGAFGPDAGVVGFDCSGLMVYAFAAIGVGVPHQTQAIWAQFQPPITDPNAVQPGDMVLLSYNGQPTGIHHVGLYLGEGRVVHAPESGSAVQIVENIWGSPYWSGRFIGAVRAIPNADLPPPGL